MPGRKDSVMDTSFFSLKRRKSPDSSDASNDQRRRITIACLRCRHRKIRCDGSDPCNKCKSAGTDCEYYAVTKEENQAAREKKALAKANRTKVLKSAPNHVSKSEDKKPSSKKRTSKTRRTASFSSESSATPEPVHQTGLHEHVHERPQLHIEPQYTLMPSQQPMQVQVTGDKGFEQEDAHSASDSAETYFGYLSSSTASLQSTVYDPAYAPEYVPFNPNHHDFHIPPPHLATDPAFYGTYDYVSAEPKMAPVAPPPVSYPMDSPQPSGLCLYIPPEEPTYSPYASASNPTTPMLSHSYNFPHASPPMYQGPIDWNSRPLVPFQEMPSHQHRNLLQQSQPHPQQLHHLHHQHQPAFNHRPRSYSDVPMYTQTVSLDQICSAGV